MIRVSLEHIGFAVTLAGKGPGGLRQDRRFGALSQHPSEAEPRMSLDAGPWIARIVMYFRVLSKVSPDDPDSGFKYREVVPKYGGNSEYSRTLWTNSALLVWPAKCAC